MSIDVPTYGQINHELVRRLEQLPAAADGPFFMLNLMQYRPLAVYEDGRETALSGVQADDAYAPLDILADLGAEVVLFGDVVAQQPGPQSWDRVAVVRYPTVRSFLDMQLRPDFIQRHEHKDAGMARTLIAMCSPLAGGPDVEGRQLVVNLAGGVTSAPTTVLPADVLLRIDGTLVGEPTDAAVLRLRPVAAVGTGTGSTAPTDGSDTTLTMTPLLDALAPWLPLATG